TQRLRKRKGRHRHFDGALRRASVSTGIFRQKSGRYLPFRSQNVAAMSKSQWCTHVWLAPPTFRYEGPWGMEGWGTEEACGGARGCVWEAKSSMPCLWVRSAKEQTFLVWSRIPVRKIQSYRGWRYFNF